MSLIRTFVHKIDIIIFWPVAGHNVGKICIVNNIFRESRLFKISIGYFMSYNNMMN